MPDDLFPVTWAGRQAIVAFPGQVDVSNAGQLRDRLLSVINRGASILIADMTGTVSLDHAGVDAIARACQRAAASGTQLRLVVTAPVVRRVLTIEGLDRLVSIYPMLEAAVAENVPGGGLHAPPGAAAGPQSGTASGVTAVPGARVITPAVLWQVLDALGDGLALTGEDGKIALVNRRCAEMLGYQREELAGLPIDELVPSEVRAAHHGYRAGYQQAPRARPMADRARLAALRKDGTTFPVEISLSPVPTATENYVLAVIRDATVGRRRGDLADLARGVVAEPPPLAKGLLDRVVRHLFEVGLSLQAAAGLPGEVARQRLGETLDQLDDVIQEIRDYAFTSGDG
ncbi:MAG TPA: PAS domain S-box protein [Streptosporangiaceae bacterium]|nr:PAS domain S-box protein [Streptosporangiaceae bacterium]